MDDARSELLVLLNRIQDAENILSRVTEHAIEMRRSLCLMDGGHDWDLFELDTVIVGRKCLKCRWSQSKADGFRE